VRNSIALACLLSALIVNATTAQCPKTHRNCYSAAPIKARYQSCPQSEYRLPSTKVPPCQTNNRCASYAVLQSYPVVQGCSVVQSHPIVDSYPVIQSYPVVQSITNSSTQNWSVVQQPSSAATRVFSQNAKQVTQNNCSCGGGGKMPSISTQIGPQATSILEYERNPFSLAGHARVGKPLDYCVQEFIACCGNGGKDCMLNYYKCAEITGEPLRHNVCPSAGPTSDD